VSDELIQFLVARAANMAAVFVGVPHQEMLAALPARFTMPRKHRVPAGNHTPRLGHILSV
jgi:hypothetical protein